MVLPRNLSSFSVTSGTQPTVSCAVTSFRRSATLTIRQNTKITWSATLKGVLRPIRRSPLKIHLSSSTKIAKKDPSFNVEHMIYRAGDRASKHQFTNHSTGRSIGSIKRVNSNVEPGHRVRRPSAEQPQPHSCCHQLIERQTIREIYRTFSTVSPNRSIVPNRMLDNKAVLSRTYYFIPARQIYGCVRRTASTSKTLRRTN